MALNPGETNPLLRFGAAALAAQSNIGGDNNEEEKKEEAQGPKHSGITGCCTWFLEGPYCVKKRLIFMGWILVGILAPIFYGLYLNQSDNGASLNTGFILCCALAILMSMYATFNFRDVIQLRNAVESLCESTKLLAAQRDKIRNEVEKLQTAHIKLEGIEDELTSSNGALRKNFKKFERWNKTIKEETKKNVDEAQSINKEFKAAIAQYKKMLIQNEKAILDKAYQHVQYSGDGKQGLNKDEFNDLLYSLPARYKLRFEKLGKTFEDFAGDDHNIDQDEFREFMNLMAEEEANCGVEIPELGIGNTKNKQKYRSRIEEEEEEYDDDDDDDGKEDEKTEN